MTRLVALDWGTSFLRAFRLGRGGALLETRRLERGIKHITDGAAGFERAFSEAVGDWLGDAVPVIASGMVGSAQGWREVPYLEVPVGLAALGLALTAVPAPGGATVHLVPGLVERGRLPNVMRGEETQIAGALPAAATAATLVGLPGSHCKWAQVRDRQVVHFDTFMTGEVYDALCERTLLGRTLRRGGAWDRAAFDRGVAVAAAPEGRAGVLSTIFSTRALGLAGALTAEAQADYLSGLLIGHELQALEDLDRHAFHRPGGVVLAGDEALCARYRRALEISGRARAAVAAEPAARGLWRVARSAGLVAETDGAGRPLARALARCGLVAILRGVRPDEAAAIGAVLHTAGIHAVEVPLNSPEPLASIRALREALPPECAVGAGTVLSPAQVADARAAGAEFVVMPHSDPAVIGAACAAGLEVAPGAATAGEALAALSAGADYVKMFPAEQLGPGTLAAWRAVLPAGTALLAVGGITTENLGGFVAAGAAGLALGSALYRPGLGASEVAAHAAAFVSAWRTATKARSEG